MDSGDYTGLLCFFGALSAEISFSGLEKNPNSSEHWTTASLPPSHIPRGAEWDTQAAVWQGLISPSNPGSCFQL